MKPPWRWPLDPRRQQAPRPRPGRFALCGGSSRRRNDPTSTAPRPISHSGQKAESRPMLAACCLHWRSNPRCDQAQPSASRTASMSRSRSGMGHGRLQPAKAASMPSPQARAVKGRVASDNPVQLPSHIANRAIDSAASATAGPCSRGTAAPRRTANSNVRDRPVSQLSRLGRDHSNKPHSNNSRRGRQAICASASLVANPTSSSTGPASSTWVGSAVLTRRTTQWNRAHWPIGPSSSASPCRTSVSCSQRIGGTIAPPNVGGQ